MNKKIKNIASVVQTKSAAVLCTLCAVLFLASCAEEEMADGTHLQKQDLRTVSVDLGMPQDKPAYADATTSRAAFDAQPAEILLGDSTLAVSRAEGSTANYSTSSWANGDQLLVRIEAGSTQARLTLQFITPNAEPISDGEPQAATAGTWYLMKSESYVKYTGDAFTAYNAVDVTPLFAEDNVNDNEMPINGTLTMHIDYSSVATQATVSIIYAPDMEWSLAQDNTVSMEQNDPATTAITAPELWTVGTNGWVTNQARLRVNTGNGNAGDVVTLTSSAFDSAWEVEPTVGEGENKKTVFTAVTDEYGNAYFYGTTVDAQGNPSALTDDFLVQLTQMRVHVSGQGETAVYTTLNTNVTLLEASDVVPVTLTATMAYKLVMSADKRNATTQTVLSVIDGSVGGKTEGTVDDVATVKAQIETAMAMDIYDFTVINQLARDYDAREAETVVGQAIHDLASDERSPNYGKISITIADATELSNDAFFECYALKSVTFNKKVSLQGYGHFDGCTALESVTFMESDNTIGLTAFHCCTKLTGIPWDKVTSIEQKAFSGCTFTGPITINQGTSLLYEAFSGCTFTGTLTINEGVTVDADAFKDAIVSNCDLVLPADQESNITASNSKLMWAGAVWKSITVGDKQYTAVGNTLCELRNGVPVKVIDDVTYAVLDGMYGNYTGTDGTEGQFNTYRDYLKAQIATAYTVGITHFYVINELGTYKYEKVVVEEFHGESYSEIIPLTLCVVGEAFTAYANENTNDRVSITLADATTVPKSAFYGCTALTDINCDKVASIGDDAFKNCTALTRVTTAATPIGNSAFSGCTNLQSATFTSADTEIVAWAFYGCTKLTTVSWNMVTSIGNNAFEGCTALVNVSSSTVTTVGNSAFKYCTSLKTVSLPEVGELWNTFSRCSALEEVYSPKVTTLTSIVFGYCTSLKQLTLGKVTSVNLEQYTHSFLEANTANCDLTLGAGQGGLSSNDNISGGIWADMQWKSITVGGEQKYPSANAQSNQ